MVINEASIQLVNKINEGSRCIVYEGSWESSSGPLVSVLVSYYVVYITEMRIAIAAIMYAVCMCEKATPVLSK